MSLQNLTLNFNCFHIFETWIWFFPQVGWWNHLMICWLSSFFLSAILEVFYIKACYCLPSSLRLGVSTGRSGLGLCPTRDRPDRIKLRKSWSAADWRGSRIGAVSFAPETRSVQSEPSTMKNPVKIVDFRQKNAKSDEDLTGSGEISLDPVRFH